MALPLINLDDKTFEELVAEAQKRIPLYTDQWTDFNLHDPGVTLIELFAWLTEMFIYRLNRVTNDGKRKFLNLMGVPNADKIEDDELDDAILAMRRDLKTVYRAVTSEDYESLLLGAPRLNVARARAVPCYHPSHPRPTPGIVTVVVAPPKPFENPQSEAALDYLREVYRFLHARRPLTCELFVMFPRYVVVSVTARVVIKPRYLKETVEQNVIRALETFLDPAHGGGHGDGWPFGRPVHHSEIYQVIDEAEGVDYVITGSLSIRDDDGNSDFTVPGHGLVRSGVHTVIAQEEENGP